jgi:hypothetical protein
MFSDSQSQVDALVAQYLPPIAAHTNADANGSARPSRLSDDQVRARALADPFRRAHTIKLWEGDWSSYPSQSEGDLGLCKDLARAGGDFDCIGRLVSESRLYRPKWDRQDYRASTIERALAEVRAERSNGTGSPAPTAGTWAPVALADVVGAIERGEVTGPVPTHLSRTDGVKILYGGLVHSLSGEPESGKGLISCAESSRLIQAQKKVLYLDFEDSEVSIVSRHLALGSTPTQIIDHLTYVRPSDPPQPDEIKRLLAAGPFELALLDGVTEAYMLLGLDPYEGSHIAKFLNKLARPFADQGAAVVQIDHVVKAKESRGRYSIGGQHKLAGIDSAFTTEVIQAPSRQTVGKVKLKVTKDRHGHVRGHAVGGVIALVRISPSDNGARVEVTLEPPDGATAQGASFRPTVLMERISRFVEGSPGATKQAIENGVTGNREYIRQALQILIDDSYIRVEIEGRTRRHHSVTAFRKDDQSPSRPQSPQVAQGDSQPSSRPVAPAPTRGDQRGDKAGRHQNPAEGEVVAQGDTDTLFGERGAQ